MSLSDNNASSGPPGETRAAARVAHELANLLDGSLRNVGLVMSSLRGAAPGPAAETGRQDVDDLIGRLETANDGLRQMASIIQQWMRQQPNPHLGQTGSRSLGEVIGQAVRLLHPGAAVRGVRITTCVSDDAARLEAGPLHPVIMNALRNAIEAVASGGGAAGRPDGHVEVIAVIDGDQVDLAVRDNGPGLEPALLDERGQFRFGLSARPQGHGLGLPLCREIAQSLGGTLELGNRAPHGAVLRLRYPVRERK